MHEFSQQLSHPAADVFAWHARPGALARLLPPWQPVRIGAEAANLRDGVTELEFPAGRTWVAQHLAQGYVEGQRFADRLTSRPFVAPIGWLHEHEISATGEATSVVRDRVHTRVPGRLVRPMFGYRHRQLADDLAIHARFADAPRLTVAVTGASGMVGTALCALLTTGGHRVIRLTRGTPTGADQRQWSPQAPAADLLAGVDAVVHLAGHSIAGRFTEEHKRSIADSRIEPTRLLAQVAREAGVTTFVSASAIGFYGADRGSDELGEQAAPGSDFLAGVVQDWEEAAEAAAPDARVVQVRTGIVQSANGGALKLQRPLFAAGLGGPMGSGEQWQSWIALDDLLDIYLTALLDDRLVGPVNAVAPQPVQQREYARTLGHVLHRPTVLPTPAFGPKVLLGSQGAEEVAMASQRVRPGVLTDLGHVFRFPDLAGALRHQLGKEPA